MIQRHVHYVRDKGYMKTDDFVLKSRQPKTEPLSGGVELVDYITGVWCLCARLQCMCVYGTGIWCLCSVCARPPHGTPPPLPSAEWLILLGYRMKTIARTITSPSLKRGEI